MQLTLSDLTYAVHYSYLAQLCNTPSAPLTRSDERLSISVTGSMPPDLALQTPTSSAVLLICKINIIMAFVRPLIKVNLKCMLIPHIDDYPNTIPKGAEVQTNRKFGGI